MYHLLEKAISIALTAHKGQVDKGGNPYILHPIRVMGSVKTIEEKIIALLHDVVEDSDITIEQLKKEGFSETTLEAINLLTKTSDCSYEDYLLRIKSNKLALEIKKADLKDNLDNSRLAELNPSDYKRIGKYKKALDLLNS